MKQAILTLLLTPFLSSLAQAEPVCVKEARAHLRSGPSKRHPITWTVAQNMPLMRLSQKSGWSHVQDLDGQKHWVASHLLTARVSCAVIKTKVAKLRRPNAAPNTKDVTVAERYTPFRKVERDGDYLIVQDEYAGRFKVHEDNLWIPMMRTRVTY